MKTLITIWLSSLVTFVCMATYLLVGEEGINVPGELGENIAAVGISLIVLLLLISGIFLFFGKRT